MFRHEMDYTVYTQFKIYFKKSHNWHNKFINLVDSFDGVKTNPYSVVKIFKIECSKINKKNSSNGIHKITC